MNHTGTIGAIIGGLVLLSAWVSPRLFRSFVLILSFIMGAVAATGIALWFWLYGRAMFALPVLSIAALGGFLLLFRRRVFVFWATATLYLVLVFPFVEFWHVLLGVPGGVMALFVARRVIEGIRKRRMRLGKSNNTPDGNRDPADGLPKPSM
jgi:hypothetical protein